MSVPQDKLMELMRSQQGGGAVPGSVPGAQSADANVPPMASPMTTPEPKMGSKEGAMVNLSMALDLIEQSLPSLGSESPEGQQAMAAIRSISGLLGPRKNKAQELQQSELLQMMQVLPQAGGMAPEAKAVMQSPTPGLPGGMPPGGGQPQPM